ncbi:MAG: hypothetical protein ACFFAN_07585 [Promethearchaeota archaeon]
MNSAVTAENVMEVTIIDEEGLEDLFELVDLEDGGDPWQVGALDDYYGRSPLGMVMWGFLGIDDNVDDIGAKFKLNLDWINESDHYVIWDAKEGKRVEIEVWEYYFDYWGFIDPDYDFNPEPDTSEIPSVIFQDSNNYNVMTYAEQVEVDVGVWEDWQKGALSIGYFFFGSWLMLPTPVADYLGEIEWQNESWTHTIYGKNPYYNLFERPDYDVDEFAWNWEADGNVVTHNGSYFAINESDDLVIADYVEKWTYDESTGFLSLYQLMNEAEEVIYEVAATSDISPPEIVDYESYKVTVIDEEGLEDLFELVDLEDGGDPWQVGALDDYYGRSPLGMVMWGFLGIDDNVDDIGAKFKLNLDWINESDHYVIWDAKEGKRVEIEVWEYYFDYWGFIDPDYDFNPEPDTSEIPSVIFQDSNNYNVMTYAEQVEVDVGVWEDWQKGALSIGYFFFGSWLMLPTPVADYLGEIEWQNESWTHTIYGKNPYYNLFERPDYDVDEFAWNWEADGNVVTHNGSYFAINESDDLVIADYVEKWTYDESTGFLSLYQLMNEAEEVIYEVAATSDISPPEIVDYESYKVTVIDEEGLEDLFELVDLEDGGDPWQVGALDDYYGRSPLGMVMWGFLGIDDNVDDIGAKFKLNLDWINESDHYVIWDAKEGKRVEIEVWEYYFDYWGFIDPDYDFNPEPDTSEIPSVIFQDSNNYNVMTYAEQVEVDVGVWEDWQKGALSIGYFFFGSWLMLPTPVADYLGEIEWQNESWTHTIYGKNPYYNLFERPDYDVGDFAWNWEADGNVVTHNGSYFAINESDDLVIADYVEKWTYDESTGFLSLYQLMNNEEEVIYEISIFEENDGSGDNGDDGNGDDDNGDDDNGDDGNGNRERDRGIPMENVSYLIIIVSVISAIGIVVIVSYILIKKHR